MKNTELKNIQYDEGIDLSPIAENKLRLSPCGA